MSTGSIGLMVAVPMRSNCSAVLTYRKAELRNDAGPVVCYLTLLIWVGRTSAEGMEKSQYRLNVFCQETRSRDELKTRKGGPTGAGSDV